MTDMRATERILEYVVEQVAEIRATRDLDVVAINAELIASAIAALRARGDTLVRRDDLMTLLEHIGHATYSLPKVVNDEFQAARERLNEALLA